MTKGRTALFGGSFDPVHLGHVRAVRALLDTLPDIAQVIVMPAAVSPFKTDRSPRATAEERLEMCRLAFGDIPACRVSDLEIQMAGVSYTVHTLEKIREMLPGEKPVLAVGSDSLQTLPHWYRGEEIVKMADIAAFSRSPEDSAAMGRYAGIIGEMGGRVTIVPIEPFAVSSTEIRERIGRGEDVSSYTGGRVAAYIGERKIYRR